MLLVRTLAHPWGTRSPALCRVRVEWESVLLDQQPSLLTLRQRCSVFVRMIHRYYAARVLPLPDLVLARTPGWKYGPEMASPEPTKRLPHNVGGTIRLTGVFVNVHVHVHESAVVGHANPLPNLRTAACGFPQSPPKSDSWR